MRPAGAHGAAPVAVSVSLETGAGRAPDGTPFTAARGRAEVRLHRARIAVEGRPVTAADATAARAGAVADLAERVADAIAW